jgi:hypothetical protein
MSVKVETPYEYDRKRWKLLGLTDRQMDDLVAIAAEYSVVTGVPMPDALLVIDERVREILKDQIADRVSDVLTYGGDLRKQ